MDPNANLIEQLALANVDWTGKDTSELTPAEVEDLHTAHARLCELVLALDGWITKGGFKPARWEAK